MTHESSQRRLLSRRLAGGDAPCAWARHLKRSVMTGVIALAPLLVACGDDEREESFGPFALGMDAASVAEMPVYDDDELTLYEVKLPIQLPILRPTDDQRRALRDLPAEPFDHYPWVTIDNLKLQITWTMTNLDPEDHDVELLIDPWNEFGRYWPGLADVGNDEFLPNLSGYDVLFALPGTARDSGETIRSRRHGTLTFQDVDEIAIDFATVINIIANPPPPMDGSDTGPEVTYVNHAFAVENRSFEDALVRAYIPRVIPALTGFDLGLRTREPANISVEVTLELVDESGERVREDDSDAQLLPEPEQYITVGSAGAP
jgi:hypothetical protein